MKIRKFCGKCKKWRTRFHKNSRNLDGLQSWCQDCNGGQMRKYYLKNKPKYAEINRGAVKRNREFILAYLKTHPCVDCGETDPVVLEFDHVRGTKVAQLSDMMFRRSLDILKKEIEKCDVRCANDHRRRTAKTRGYYKVQS